MSEYPPFEAPPPEEGESRENTPTLPAPPPSTLTLTGSPKEQATFFAAFANARAEFGKVLRSSEGRITATQTFQYASLASITEVTADVLGKHGLAVVHLFHGECDRITQIVSGHGCQLRTDLIVRSLSAARNVKEWGALTTYYRRYLYQATFVLEGEADADQAPVETPQRPRQQAPSKPSQPRAARAAKAAPAPEPTPEPEPEPEPTPEPEEPTAADAMTQVTKDKIGQLCRELEYNAKQATEVCFDVTGKTPATVTEADGHKLLSYLEEMRGQ